jgi:AAA domain/CHC2 zinc finger/Toprim-like
VAYDKEYLDRIRSAFKVSEIVGRKFKLRKHGAEFVAVDDPSISVNDRKGIWHDFGSHKEGGDVFEFLQVHEGYTFVQAVEELAQKAGIHAPANRKARSNGSAANHTVDRARADHQGTGPSAYDDGYDEALGAGAEHVVVASKKEIVATYDYPDPKGALLYQVVRMQKRLPDGAWELGKNRKPWKSFGQRRRSPDGDGQWVWGLDFIDRQTSQPLEFMRKGPGTDWVRFDEANYRQWHWTERRMFPGVGNVDHWLYNANEIADELREDALDQRTIFLPEGEGKVEILKEWDLLGVTSSGGSQNFSEAMAKFFAGAADVVLLEDNDPAGRARTARVAPMLRKAGARVRVLNFQSVWPQCPMRGDIKDWRDQGGGSRTALLEIVDKLPEWTPAPYRSKFGAVRWREQYMTSVRIYEWLIRGLVPFGKSLLIYGESQSGKSFLALCMAMAVALGITFNGRKSKQAGVVYCAAEKGEGFVNRMRAYEKANNIGTGDLPFVVLTKSLDLWSQESTTDDLIAEIKALSADWDVPLGVVVLDTYQAASPGASIIKDEDVTTMYRRANRIMEATGAGVWFVHHKNAHGTIRGSLVLWNSIETTIEIDSRKIDRQGTELRDDDKRVIRRATVRKQSEEVAGAYWDFVVKRIVLGTDTDGGEITSCVVEAPNMVPVSAEDEKKEGQRSDGYGLSEINAIIFRALLKSIDEDGFVPPPTMKLPASVTRVTKWEDVRRRYKSVTPNDELGKTPSDQSNNFKGRVGRFRRLAMNANLVGMDEIELVAGQPLVSVIWPTGKRVVGRGLGGGWPTRAKKQSDEPIIDKATGLPLEVF